MSSPTLTKDEAANPAPAPKEPAEAPQEAAAPSALARFLGNPKTLALLVAILVVVVSALVTGAGTWPRSLTADVQSPLNDLDNWLVDNRESHWIFLYFLLHISNFAQASYDTLLSLLESMSYVGVIVVGTLIAWAAGGADLSRRALRAPAARHSRSSWCAGCWTCGNRRWRRWR